MKKLKPLFTYQYIELIKFIQQKNAQVILLLGISYFLLLSKEVPKLDNYISFKLIFFIIGILGVALLKLNNIFFLKLAIFIFCLIPVTLILGKFGAADRLSAYFLFSMVFGIILVPIINAVCTWWEKI